MRWIYRLGPEGREFAFGTILGASLAVTAFIGFLIYMVAS